MKYLFTLLFCFGLSIIFGQKFEELKNGDRTYFQYIANFDSTMNKGALYDLFNLNILRAYKQTIAKSDITDEGDGKIHAKCRSGKLIYHNGIKKDGGYFTYTLHVISKDGKAKIVIDDIYYYAGEMVQMKNGANFSLDEPDTWKRSFMWNGQSKKEWAKMKDQFRDEINTLLPELVAVNSNISDDF